MDKGLTKLLKDIGCQDDLIEVVNTRRITDVIMFSNCGTSTTDIVEAILGGSELATDLPSKALIRSAWEKATSIKQRTLKRQLDGLADEPEDTVMNAQAQDELMTKFRTFYQIKSIPPLKIVTDQLIYAWRKEFEKHRVTPFQMNRTKTQAEGIMRAPQKRSKLNDNIAIMINEELPLLDTARECLDLLTWLTTCELVCFSWAVAGCFEVQFAVPPSTTTEEMLCVHLQETVDYRWEFEQRTPDLRERYHDWSIARYYNATEGEFRTKAIELDRGPLKYPWGKALTCSVKTNPHLWSKHENLLVELDRHRKRRQDPPQPLTTIPGLLAIENAQPSTPIRAKEVARTTKVVEKAERRSELFARGTAQTMRSCVSDTMISADATHRIASTSTSVM